MWKGESRKEVGVSEEDHICYMLFSLSVHYTIIFYYIWYFGSHISQNSKSCFNFINGQHFMKNII